MALCDAAARLANLAGSGADGYPPPPPAGVTPGRGGARPATIEASLDLSRAAVKACPSLGDAWDGVVALGAAGRLSPAQRQAWANAVYQFCVKDYPDFAAGALGAIIAGIPDTADQARLWDWAVQRFVGRPDFAADMVLAKARMWEEAGQKGPAYEGYLRVIDQFGDRTPLAPGALRAAEKLLAGGARERGRASVPFGRADDPDAVGRRAAVIAASNWYQIGAAYARRLDQAGRKAEAEQVRRQLDASRLQDK